MKKLLLLLLLPLLCSCEQSMKTTSKKTFHHIGLPTDVSQPGEIFVADTKVWVTDPRKHPYKVEFLRFEKDSPAKGPVRDMPHVAYRVDDVNAAIRGKEVLLKPFNPTPGLTVAFVLKDGLVVEYMKFDKETDLPWK
jgi:hypothetical protein